MAVKTVLGLNSENRKLRAQLRDAQDAVDPFKDYGPERATQTRIVGIEFVIPIDQEDSEGVIERALEELRCIGSADVVKQCFSDMSFEEACNILDEHAKNCV